MTGLGLDTCLQCGQTRAQVKANNTFCATATGYEVVETKDEWDRHHWRDWSDVELERFGVHPSLWEANRRTNIYDLVWVQRESLCLEEGHMYFTKTGPPWSREVMQMFPPSLCMCCYEEKETPND